jgi:hypothetical protein
VFARSRKPNKVLVMVTDGQWDNAAACNEIISNLNAAGVITCIIGLGGAIRAYGTHGCKISADISNPMAVVRFVEKLVAQISLEALRRR